MRRGLTLIELLVTIVIMVTVLAAVLPMVSPNNNSRKMREASRQLNTLLAQAKARAAASGRPCGITLTESGASSPYSGLALEASLSETPPPFAGFSEHSRAIVEWVGGLTYGATGAAPNEGTLFLPKYEGYPVCRINFVASGALDSFPPRMLKIGDTIEVAGNRFLICDDKDKYAMPNQVEAEGVEYLVSDPTKPTPTPGTTLNAIWVNYQGGSILPQATSGQMYAFSRQPTPSADSAIQFPRGIGIDMQVSGADVTTGAIPSQFYWFDAIGKTTVTILFSPNGELSDVYMDGVLLQSIANVHLLLGLIENGNGTTLTEELDFTNYPPADESEMSIRRGRLNWLNPDGRWVSVNRAGQISSDNVAIFNVLDNTKDFNGDQQMLPLDWKDQVFASQRFIRDAE